jgi:hypothetical protein
MPTAPWTIAASSTATDSTAIAAAPGTAAP